MQQKKIEQKDGHYVHDLYKEFFSACIMLFISVIADCRLNNFSCKYLFFDYCGIAFCRTS